MYNTTEKCSYHQHRILSYKNVTSSLQKLKNPQKVTKCETMRRRVTDICTEFENYCKKSHFTTFASEASYVSSESNSNSPKIHSKNPEFQILQNFKFQNSKNRELQKSRIPKIQISKNSELQKSKNPEFQKPKNQVLDFFEEFGSNYENTQSQCCKMSLFCSFCMIFNHCAFLELI